jgi:hypothetical protein
MPEPPRRLSGPRLQGHASSTTPQPRGTRLHHHAALQAHRQEQHASATPRLGLTAKRDMPPSRRASGSAPGGTCVRHAPRAHRQEGHASATPRLGLTVEGVMSAHQGRHARPDSRIRWSRARSRVFPPVVPRVIHSHPRHHPIIPSDTRVTGRHPQALVSTSERHRIVPTLSTPIHRRAQEVIPSGGKLGRPEPTDVDEAWGNRCGQTRGVTAVLTPCGRVWISC